MAGFVSPHAGRRRPAARRARRRALQRSAGGRRSAARSRATSPARGGCRKACYGGGRAARGARAARAVAWPTPTRAYAVGDLKARCGCGAAKPACGNRIRRRPFNFRGNLLGVAFDPNKPARGYAVGQGGVLLRYGKTWTQEELPPQVSGASFTSIAFAGSEAIVAYRQLPDPPLNQYVGGLLVNDGSGWRVDQQARRRDGGKRAAGRRRAAGRGRRLRAPPVSARRRGLRARPRPANRGRRPPTPLPGGRQPGSLALFREGGALRAIASGTRCRHGFDAESVTAATARLPADADRALSARSGEAACCARRRPAGATRSTN